MDMPNGHAGTLPPATPEPSLAEQIRAIAPDDPIALAGAALLDAGMSPAEVLEAVVLVASGHPGIRAERGRRLLAEAGLHNALIPPAAHEVPDPTRRQRAVVELETSDAGEWPVSDLLKSLGALERVKSWIHVEGEALNRRIRWQIVNVDSWRPPLQVTDALVDRVAEAMAGWPMDTAPFEDACAWRANARAAIDVIRAEG